MRTLFAVLAFTIAGLIAAGTASAQVDPEDVAITLGADDGSSSLEVRNHSGTAKATVTDAGDMTVTGDLGFADGTSQSGAGVTFDDSVSSMRLVRGAVMQDSPLATRGEGFTVIEPENGIFSVTFDPQFSAVPICTCSVDANPPDRVYTCSSAVDQTGAAVFYTSQLRFEESNPSFEQVGLDFSFICVGP